MLVVWFYLLVFASALVMTSIFFYRSKRVDVLLVLFLASVMLDSMGRFLISVSENAGQAVWANKFVYIGACFTPLFLVLVMARVCEIKIPKIVSALLFFASLAVISLAMTVGFNEIFYKSVSLERSGGFSYLKKEYGPAHIAFPILLGIDVLMMIYIIIKAFRNRKKIPFKSVLTICGLCIFTIALYLLSRVLHSKVEWLSVGYLTAVIVFMRMFEHMNMYDMSENIATSVERLREYGYIVFDNKRRFISANELVISYFPEIDEWFTEEPVKPSDSELYTGIIKWYYAWCDGNKEVKIVRIKGLYLELSVKDIIHGRQKRKVGDLIEFIDRTAEHKYTAAIENYNAELSADVAAKTAHISEIRDKMVLALAMMIESRDDSTGGHIQRTSDCVSMFAISLFEHASELGVDMDFLDMVIRAAPMHDLGKIAVDDSILKKQGKFTPEDYAEMKKHSAEGAKIVRHILSGVEDEAFVRIAENVAHYHHEKWNGTGYPCGLAGEEIPIEARIMALADVFDALVSKRCYKEPFSYDEAFEIIKNDLGTHFDPVLGKLFIECRPELEELYDALKAEESTAASAEQKILI